MLCGACKLAAGVSFATGLLEPLATACLVVYFALISHAHYSMGDDVLAPLVLMALALFKLVNGPSAAATPTSTQKRSE
jgi:hypothetical protein